MKYISFKKYLNYRLSNNKSLINKMAITILIMAINQIKDVLHTF